MQTEDDVDAALQFEEDYEDHGGFLCQEEDDIEDAALLEATLQAEARMSANAGNQQAADSRDPQNTAFGSFPTMDTSNEVEPVAKRRRPVVIQHDIPSDFAQAGFSPSASSTAPPPQLAAEASSGAEASQPEDSHLRRSSRSKTPVEALSDRLRELCLGSKPGDCQQPGQMSGNPCKLRHDLGRYRASLQGFDVLFPFSQGPMEPQRQVMAGVLEALNAGSHAVLESPTGTGKTAAVLCAALEWQRRRKEEKGTAPQLIFASRTHAQLKQAIAELRQTAYRPVMSILGSREAGLCVQPEISGEDKAMHVRQACRQARQQGRCDFHAGLQRPQLPEFAVEKLRSGEPWDIEDVANFGRSATACPYYMAHALSKYADLVFCPYSYVLDPSVRQAAGSSCIDLKGCVIILDEAHNVEGVCRDAGSAEITLDQVQGALAALKRMLGEDAGEPAPQQRSAPAHTRRTEELGGFMLPGSVQAASWTQQAPATSESAADRSRGNKVPQTLAKMLRPIQGLLQRLRSFVADAKEAAVFAPQLEPGRQAQSLLKALKLDSEPLLRPGPVGKCPGPGAMPRGEAMLRELVSHGLAGPWASQLELAAALLGQLASAVAQPELYAARVDPGARGERQGLQLWLMSAEGTMRSVASSVHSMLLMSGTLAPLSTTVAELGHTFVQRALRPVAAGHVVGPESLKLISIAQATSATSTKLECTFRAWKRPSFLRTLGQALVTVVKAIPAGVLVFLPSYELLERCLEAWQQTETTSADHECGFGSARGKVGRGGRAKRRYRGAVERIPVEGLPALESQGSRILECLQEAKGHLVIEPEPASSDAQAYKLAKQRYEHAVRQDGRALLLAVYRGRMSEGVSFDDDFSRGVVCIGIPFPNLTEERIAQKRACNDFWVSKGMSRVSGDAWYESKALQAVAQALGRCIRHPADFGALVLLDSRWAELGKAASLPQWLQPFVEDKLDADLAAECLQAHFQTLAHRLPSRRKEDPKVATTDIELNKIEHAPSSDPKDEVKVELNYTMKSDVNGELKDMPKEGVVKNNADTECDQVHNKSAAASGASKAMAPCPAPGRPTAFRRLLSTASKASVEIDLDD